MGWFVGVRDLVLIRYRDAGGYLRAGTVVLPGFNGAAGGSVLAGGACSAAFDVWLLVAGI